MLHSSGELWIGPDAAFGKGPCAARVHGGAPPNSRWQLVRAVPPGRSGSDDLLLWFTELAGRLRSGLHIAEEIVPMKPRTLGIDQARTQCTAATPCTFPSVHC